MAIIFNFCYEFNLRIMIFFRFSNISVSMARKTDFKLKYQKKTIKISRNLLLDTRIFSGVG